MSEQQASHDTRTKLLRTACAIALEQGISHVTLDNVAKAAGVSKGGLIYHFAGKEALLQGMVDYLLDSFAAEIETHLNGSEREAVPGQWLRAYVRANLDKDQSELQLSIALLAAVAVNPALLQRWRDRYAAWQQTLLQTSADPVLATIIRLATDGMWLMDLLNIAPADERLRQQIQQRLLSMTRTSEDTSRDS